MLKSKTMFGLIALVMVLALAQSGYAQLSLSVTGNPAPRETQTSRTAETNDPLLGNGLIITGQLLSDAYVTGGRLRITYPARVTNNTSVPTGDGITISTATGIFAGATIGAVSNTNGRVDINLPCGTQTGVGGTNALGTGSGTMILTGVRIDASALATAPVSATLSTTSYSSTATPRGVGCAAGVTVDPANVSVTTPSVEVLSSLQPGIGTVVNGGMPGGTSTSSIFLGGATSAGTGTAGPTPGCNGGDLAHQDCGVATVYTNRNVPDAAASFSVTEGHRTAWFNASSDQFPGALFNNDAGFRLTFNGLPAGVTLTLAVGASTSGQPVLSRTAITSANNTSNVTWGANVSTDTTLDRVTFSITGINVSSTATLVPGTVTVTASMFPIGEALDENDAVISSTFPRYAAAEVGTATVVSLVPANTTLLIPFALVSGNYDTGIAIANTSADPFGSSTGGATAQAGTVRLDLYPSNSTGAGTAVNFTTSATKKAGIGIAADGTIPAGATWIVNLSELLPLAPVTAPFTGYIFVQANFLYAHGAAYVYDGRGFTSATPVLVLPPPSINGRIGIANQATAETLAY